MLKFADAEVDGQLQAAALPPRVNDDAPVDDAASSTAVQSQGSSDFDDWQSSDEEWAQIAAASP